MSGNLRKIGALWRKDGAKGEFYSGTLNADEAKSGLAGSETRLLLFPVRNKRPRGPDFELFCAPDDRREQPVATTATPVHQRPSRVADPDDPFDL